jgi:hypothetical protein
MIEKLSVQLYPFTNFSKNQRRELLHSIKNAGIENLETTSKIEKEWDLSGFNTIGVHLNDDTETLSNNVIPSLVHEGDFIFPISMLSMLIGRKNLINIGNLIFQNKYRRPFINSLSTKNYLKKGYWIELACWLNSLNKKITIHNHEYELSNFIDGESPWEILHRYTTPNIRFQLDPQNLKNSTNLEEVLIRFHQRIDSIHIDLDDPILNETDRNNIIEFSKIISRPINLIIEQTKPDIEKLKNQIIKLKQLI